MDLLTLEFGNCNDWSPVSHRQGPRVHYAQSDGNGGVQWTEWRLETLFSYLNLRIRQVTRPWLFCMSTMPSHVFKEVPKARLWTKKMPPCCLFDAASRPTYRGSFFRVPLRIKITVVIREKQDWIFGPYFSGPVKCFWWTTERSQYHPAHLLKNDLNVPSVGQNGPTFACSRRTMVIWWFV